MKKEDLINLIDENYDSEDEILYMLWSKEDVSFRCNNLGITLSEKEKNKVLKCIDQDKTIDLGINWNVMDIYIIAISEENKNKK